MPCVTIVRMTSTPERRRSRTESPADAPDIPAGELLGYLGLPAYPPDRTEDPGHARRRDEGRAVDAAARAAWEAEADDVSGA